MLHNSFVFLSQMILPVASELALFRRRQTMIPTPVIFLASLTFLVSPSAFLFRVDSIFLTGFRSNHSDSSRSDSITFIQSLNSLFVKRPSNASIIFLRSVVDSFRGNSIWWEEIRKKVAATTTCSDSRRGWACNTGSRVLRIYASDIELPSLVHSWPTTPITSVDFTLSFAGAFIGRSSGILALNVPMIRLNTFSGIGIGLCFNNFGGGKFNEVARLSLALFLELTTVQQQAMTRTRRGRVLHPDEEELHVVIYHEWRMRWMLIREVMRKQWEEDVSRHCEIRRS